ncbi:unnamed protein product [Moneuplotes crassus]|uniref:Uncharacterized protein n=1 Tax=Euplotes crassus TaxID=5936 RepID=A0AAD1XLH8_EUPCR|nr:unnamed protein product [Moneuplotes crassus]
MLKKRGPELTAPFYRKLIDLVCSEIGISETPLDYFHFMCIGLLNYHISKLSHHVDS